MCGFLPSRKGWTTARSSFLQDLFSSSEYKSLWLPHFPTMHFNNQQRETRCSSSQKSGICSCSWLISSCSVSVLKIGEVLTPKPDTCCWNFRQLELLLLLRSAVAAGNIWMWRRALCFWQVPKGNRQKLPTNKPTQECKLQNRLLLFFEF